MCEFIDNDRNEPERFSAMVVTAQYVIDVLASCLIKFSEHLIVFRNGNK